MPSVDIEPMDNAPSPYLPAMVMPEGLTIDAAAMGISSWSGRICNAASLTSNHSHLYVNRGSPASSRLMTPMASSWRSRSTIGSMPKVWASEGSAPGPVPSIARPWLMWSSWTMRWATLNG